MISLDPEPAAAARLDLRGPTEDFFRAGGRLQKACAGETFPYEPRPQQAAMAMAVAAALEDRHHLTVEAGTGVGKSFAYLVPCILTALRCGKPAVVSTYTISLQEQLMFKDVPFLQQHLGQPFNAVLVKGKGNYLCLRRLARAEKMGADLFRAGETEQLRRLRAWAETTDDGSLQSLKEQPPSSLWSAVCVEEGNCLGAKCPDMRRCFFMRARRRMQEGHLLIVNHHLLMSDLALRLSKSGFLPEYDQVVLDEAHQLENVAGEHLGVRLSQYAFDHWMRRLYVPETNKGLLALLRAGDAANGIVRLREEVDRFFEAVRGMARLDERSPRRIETPLPLETATAAHLTELLNAVRKLAEGVEDEDLKSELTAACRRGADLRTEFDAFLHQTMDDHVYWTALEGRRQQTVLYSAPIEVGPILREQFFAEIPTVVLTSATLAVNDSLDYYCARIGLEDGERLCVGSPFDYARQMRIEIPTRMPDPNDADAYVPAVKKAVMHFVGKTRGSAFVLFTSAQLMRRVAEAVRDDLLAAKHRLLVQGEDLARHAMLEAFIATPGSVLFGLDSFWMGVDVRGDALRNVIITRLPFAVPDQPLIKARMDRITERGGDAFKEYSLPEAVIKFRQGVGRLIRTATDEGIVVILDRRIAQKWYGRWFLKSLPDTPVEQVDID